MTAPSLLSALLALSAIHLVGAMVPGPNIVVTAHVAGTRGARQGLLCVAGIVVATLTWVSLTLAGVGIVLQELGALYNGLKLAGAAYLVWLGARMLWGAIWQAPGPRAAASEPKRLPVAAFRLGVLTNLANPKSAVFWTSVFIVAVPPSAPVWFYVAVIAIIGIQTGLWYGLVALAFAAPPAQAAFQRMNRYLAGLAGSLMIGFGIKLALGTDDAAAR
ncbi:LysE family translocator [Microbaculum marinum]|uniref:LysE family translocator n=1 Tax=Microbaculum marinum TaxID=1764581 RepID=A0AAW9RIW2_9HYPH